MVETFVVVNEYYFSRRESQIDFFKMATFQVNYQPSDYWLQTVPPVAIPPTQVVDGVIDKNLKEQVKRVLTQIEESETSLSQLQLRYISLIDQDLDNNKPFAWNSKNKVDLNRDIQHYLQLIRYCMYAENFYLIKKWGIDYPCSPNVRQANSISEYVNAFKEFSENQNFLEQYGFSSKAIPYFKYLIAELSKDQQ